MNQLLQSLKTGELALVEVPPLAIGARAILVRTHASLVSAGMQRHSPTLRDRPRQNL
jgi:hypothetical protein